MFCPMSSRHLVLALGGLALLAPLVGCTTTTSTGAAPSSSSGGGGGSPDGGAAAKAPLGCLGILTCVKNDSCTTDACTNACLTQGSADAQKQVTDLATCNQNAGCSDSTCLQTNCKSELAACLAGSTPPATGTTPTGTAPPGSVPSSFVGTWVAGFSGTTSENELQFGADGSGLYEESYNGGIGECASAVVAKYQGSAVIDPNAATIKVYATTVTELTNTCGTPSTKNQPAKTLSFTYQDDSLGDGGIFVIDADCASQYTRQADINVYCGATYRKK